ncbi:MAG TPA: helix-turn-helix transcriptional regulator [Vicinamibacterales bacterium]|nr:helix-turn-helix transcriptional regulator [Vicinamibacterales bacterium]
MARDPLTLLPLKPLVFHLLVALLEEDLHGWALLRAVETQPDGDRLMPGQLYRQLEAMLDEGLIVEQRGAKKDADDEPAKKGGAPPKRFFRLTAFGREVARAEARRLEGVMADARVRRLLSRSRS